MKTDEHKTQNQKRKNLQIIVITLFTMFATYKAIGALEALAQETNVIDRKIEIAPIVENMREGSYSEAGVKCSVTTID